MSLYTYLPMKMEQTECSETSAYKIQTPGNYPEENIQQVSCCLKYFWYRVFNELQEKCCMVNSSMLGRCRRMLKDDVNVDCKEVDWKVVDSIHLAQCSQECS